MNGLQMRSSRCLAAAARALYIWAIGPEDVELVEKTWNHQVERLLETGSTQRDQASVRNYNGTRPLKIVWSGRHLGRKALPILLETLAKLRDAGSTSLQLTVLGDGPETAHWKHIAQNLKLSNIIWAGNLSQAAALDEVANSDILAFTSVLEGTPHVVVEALSLGVPVICHRACGMGSAVTPDSGLLIEMKDPATSVKAFATAIQKLMDNPAELTRLSQGALNRANELSWDRLVEKLVDGYARVPGRAISH